MTRSLNRILIVAASAVTISLFTAGATTVPTCASNVSLAFYESTYNLGGTSGVGCQIGDKIFNNFSYGASGSNQIPASQVTVLGLGPGEGQTSTFFPNDIGLQFDAPWVASSAGTSSDAAIGFTVTVVNGSNMQIEDAGLFQSAGPGSGPGTPTVTELGCSGIVYPCTQVWGVATSASNPINNTMFTPTGSISVAKDISVTGAAGGSTEISIVQDVFSQTTIPEPRSTAAVLSLLIVGLVFRKKFQSVRG